VKILCTHDNILGTTKANWRWCNWPTVSASQSNEWEEDTRPLSGSQWCVLPAKKSLTGFDLLPVSFTQVLPGACDIFVRRQGNSNWSKSSRNGFRNKWNSQLAALDLPKVITHCQTMAVVTVNTVWSQLTGSTKSVSRLHFPSRLSKRDDRPRMSNVQLYLRIRSKIVATYSC